MTTPNPEINQKKAKKKQAKAERKGNRAVVLRFMKEGIGKSDLAVFDECLHPEVRVWTGLKAQGPIEGLAEYKQIFAGFADAWPVRQFVLDEVIAAKDKVVVRFTATAAFKKDYYGIAATNQIVDMKEVHVLTLKDGKVVSNIVSGTNFPFEYIMYPVLKEGVIGHLALDTEA